MPTPLNVDIAINTADSAQSLQELRTSLRDLISAQGQVGAGSEQFRRLQTAINDTEGRVGDLTDSFQTLRGSGVERVNASLNLFSQGLANADPGQLSAGIQGLSSAFTLATGVAFILVEGLKFLIQNFDKVKAAITDTRKVSDELAKSFEDLSIAQQNYIQQTEAQVKLSATQNQNDELEIQALKDKKAGYTEIAEKINEIYKRNDESIRNERKLLNAEEATKEARLETIRQITRETLANYTVREQAAKNYSDEDKKILADNRKEANELVSFLGTIPKRRETINNEIVNNELKNQKELKDLRQFYIDELQKELDFIKKAAEEGISIARGRTEKERQQQYERIKNMRDYINKREALQEELINNSIAADNQLFEQGQAQADKDIAVTKEYNALKLSNNKNTLAEKQAALKSNYLIEKSNALANGIDIYAIELKYSQDSIKLVEDEEAKKKAIRDAADAKALSDAAKAAAAKLKQQQEEAAVRASYQQAANDAVNAANAIITENENYYLNEQRNNKDQALVNDDYRRDKALQKNQMYYNDLLSNQGLSEEERVKIQTAAENERQDIEYQSKLNQYTITQEFNKKQDEVNKEQFERNKKLQIVMGIVNTAASVLNASTLQPYPVAVAAMIAAGVAGAAQVAIISNQKYQSTNAVSIPPPIKPGAISSGAPSSGTNGGAGTPNAQGAQFDPTKIQNAQGNTATKVYVLQSDIADVTNKVNVIESRANFR